MEKCAHGSSLIGILLSRRSLYAQVIRDSVSSHPQTESIMPTAAKKTVKATAKKSTKKSEGEAKLKQVNRDFLSGCPFIDC